MSMVVMMRMLVLRVIMLALVCWLFYWLNEFSNDETEHIRQLGRISTTGPIAYAFNMHQRERPKIASQCRDNRGPRGGGHFLANNAGVGRIAFQQLQRRRGWHWQEAVCCTY
jgi:hypothetical protein